MRLDELRGNEPARQLLRRALERGVVPHALLFHGPRGVGKAEVAQALAEALLCEHPQPDACGRCGSCWRSSRRGHPDLLFLEREDDAQLIRIEAARAIVHAARLKPFEGRAKVVLVPEAERLSEESANTLLKTIEEPPPATYLVLVTSSREGVLPTIRSRCQNLAFRALTRAELVARLTEQHGLDAEEAELRARLALGSESAALELDLEARRARREQALAALLPLAAGQLGPPEVERALALAEQVAAKDGAAEEMMFTTLRGLARDALVLASGGGADTLLDREAEAALRELAAGLGTGGAAALLADLERAESDLRVNANRRLLLEAILLGVWLRTGAGPAQRH